MGPVLFLERGQIMTTKGPLALSSLKKVEERSRVPCGVSVQTSYYQGEELVRRDQLVIADRPLAEIIAETGRAG